MSSVFVFGASGFIGSHVASIFVQNGYKVYGLVRKADQVDTLLQREITPVLAEVSETGKWHPVILKTDIVIDAITGGPDQVVILNELIKLKKENPKWSFLPIYTSGTAVYGHHPGLNASVNEHTQPNKVEGLEMISGRIFVEDKYIEELNGVVILPSALFGSSGSYLSLILKPIAEGKGTFSSYGTADKNIPFVHAYDLAKAYLLAAQQPSKSRGQKFIVSTDNIKITDLVEAIATSASIKIEKYNFLPTDKSNIYSLLLSISQRLDATKIKLQLGWNPVQPSILANPKRYYDAWLKSQTN